MMSVGLLSLTVLLPIVGAALLLLIRNPDGGNDRLVRWTTLGVSIAAMMRNLATETRKRRRQNAHAQIQKAPVKMLFPLVFLIFPALMIVLLYPAVSQLLEQLGGH